MNKYFKTNSVARQFFEYDKIFENEKIDELMKKMADLSTELFKRMNFDLAPKKDRKLDKIREKLSDIANSKTGIEALAKIKDYSEENDLIDGNYSDAKNLYLDSLNSLIDAVKIASGLSKEKDRNFVKYTKENAEKVQGALNEIAEKLSKLNSKKNESEEFIEDDNINESFLVGYNGRIKRLRDRLTDLTSSAEGKDSRNGYSKSWKRIFMELSQKLSALDTTRDGTGTKDKSNLSQLEKDVDKYQAEYNKAVIASTEKELKNIESDEELRDAYIDVIELVTKSLDTFSTAASAQKTAEELVNDKIDARENKFNDSIFPIKIGDKDTDSKFDESALIANIQKSLMDGINVVDTFLRDKGGADGKYGNATASVVAALQKQSGNKNANGEIDRPLLDVILASDFVSPDDREKIIASLDKMRETSTNESVTRGSDKILMSGDFFKLLEEEKIRLDKVTLGDTINTYYEEFRGKSKGSNLDISKAGSENSSKSFVESIAKSLRKNGIKVEGDDLIKDDDTLKKKYSTEFLKAWKYAIENAEDQIFFFYDEGVYYMKSHKTSLNTPMNIYKWEKSLGEDAEDYKDFIKNYSIIFKTIAKLNREKSYEVIDEYFNIIDKIDGFQLKGIYEKIKKPLLNKVPYIAIEDLKGPIAKALRNLIQEDAADRGDANLGIEDFIGINNILIMLAGVFSYDSEKMISAAEWVRENILTSDVIKRLNEDGYYETWAVSVNGPILYLGENGLEIRKKMPSAANQDVTVRGYYGSALNDVLGNVETNGKYKKLTTYIKKPFLTKGLMDGHLKRMNSKEFEDVPQIDGNRCIDVTLDDIKE